MMSDIDMQLEARFWMAADTSNIGELRKVYTKLTELHDTLTMDK
jgi:hypothetical protein